MNNEKIIVIINDKNWDIFINLYNIENCKPVSLYTINLI